MTDDELMKIAEAEYWKSPGAWWLIYARRRVQSHHAALMAKADLLEYGRSVCPETIAALNALIVTLPVDPLVEEAEKIAMGHHRFRDKDGREQSISLALEAIKRGIELAKRGEG